VRLVLPGPILIPLIAAFLYATAAIFLKRALAEGAGRWRVTFACNMVMALGYQVCWAVRTQPFSGIGAMHAGLAACTFFSGQIFTFLALSRGDVSVVTPILGTKVIWVAVFSMLLAGHGQSPHIWIAVFATALGAAILGYQPGTHPRHVALSVGAALATSCSFGMTDVLVQRYAPGWGFGSFVPMMFLLVGVLSLGLIPLLKEGGWAPASVGTGAALLAVQALGLAFALTTYGEATRVNIAYNSRGLWSVMLIWVFGHWFRNTEREAGTQTMLRRLAGASLLVTAIFIASR
jgi:drug/metabolite transporter (DMT)-like permease